MTVNLNAMQKAVDAMKKAVDDLNNSLGNLTGKQEEEKKSLRQLAKEQEGYTRRSKIMKTVAKENNDVMSLGIKTLLQYREAGGTTFEYLASYMSGASEQLRIFGFEVAGVRRFLYGFMPAGTFSMLNKFATYFNTFGGFIRFLKGDLDEAKGSLMGSLKMMKKLLPTFSGFGRSELIKSSKKGMKFYEGKLRNVNKALKNPNLSQSTRDELLAARSNFQKRVDTNKDTLLKQRKLRNRGMLNDMTGGFFKGIGSAREFFGMEKGQSVGDKFFKSPLWKAVKGIGGGIKFVFSMGFVKLLGKGLSKLFKGAGMFFVTVARFTLYFTLVISGLFILFHAFKTPVMEAFAAIREGLAFAFAIVAMGFNTIWEGIQEIYHAFKAGDFIGVLLGIWTIVWGVIQIAGGLLLAAVLGIGGLVWGALKGFAIGAYNYAKGVFEGGRKSLGLIAVGVLAILGLIFGWPIVVAGLVALLIGTLFKKLKFFGDGGVSTGGMAVVGERGPELVNLPAGSRVHSSTQSKKMSSSSNVINITINARDTSDAELRRIADKIGSMVNNKINRRTGSGTLG